MCLWGCASINNVQGDMYIYFNRIKRRVVRKMYLTTLGKFQSGSSGGVRSAGTVQTSEDESKPILSGLFITAYIIIHVRIM